MPPQSTSLHLSHGSTLKSSWTPLKKGPSNEQLFEERRALLLKWWMKWSNEQRQLVLEDLLSNSRTEQKVFAETFLSTTFPARNADFTRILPRHLTLYIFSFLDPRSLCRAAQVCWFWKYLSEEDGLWMGKNVRFGWTLGFAPTPFECGVWKRNYINKVQQLVTHVPELAKPVKAPRSVKGDETGDHEGPNLSNMSLTNHGKPNNPPPWRANDRHPTDLVRYNFLDNDDSNKSQALFEERKKKALMAKSEINLRHSISAGGPRMSSANRSNMSASNTSLTRKSIQDMSRISQPSEPPVQKPQPKPRATLPPSGAHLEKKESHVPTNAWTEGGLDSLSGEAKTSYIINRSNRDLPSHELFPKNPWRSAVYESDEED